MREMNIRPMIEEERITITNHHTLEFYGKNREINDKHVASLLKSVMSTGQFLSAIKVVNNNGRYVVIEGNHRLAVRNILMDLGHDVHMYADLVKLGDMTIDEYFENINISKKQNASDFKYRATKFNSEYYAYDRAKKKANVMYGISMNDGTGTLVGFGKALKSTECKTTELSFNHKKYAKFVSFVADK